MVNFKLLIISIAYIFSLPSLAGPQASSITANLDHGQIIKGYDPVSYFNSSKPTKGNPEFKTEINGITYLFTNKTNQQLFVSNPKKFSPEYEGWCATAVANGYKYDIDPENYKITNGRLFLFYKGWKGDAKTAWDKAEQESIKKADMNWTTVKDSKE
ncbi:MAG: YHS domain-containing (seleno)protein [Pseudobdellovibrio sp.]